MDLKDFLNRVKILRSIDSYELVAVGLTHNQWLTFTSGPIDFLMHQDDEVVSKVWAIVIAAIMADQVDDALEALKRAEKGGA